MAPAEVPPMLIKRKRPARFVMACGYTTPLVMPPFMTMSQVRSSEAESGACMVQGAPTKARRMPVEEIDTSGRRLPGTGG